VRFMGESESIFELLQDCNIFLMPSRSEGFSNALLEAMACSLPCVATRVGGNPEAVKDGHSGYLVDVGDSNAAAEKIIQLVRSPSQARQMGLIGRKIVEQQFSMDIFTNRMNEVYNHLLGARGYFP
jgi:glycosyltransferase involved in cell wall biosynthesis